MTIENFDHGQRTAAGFIDLSSDPGPRVCRAIGIRSAERITVGRVRLELVDGLGIGEFFPLANRAQGQDGLIIVEREDDFHAVISLLTSGNALEDGSCWFALHKIAGNGGPVPFTYEGPPG